MKTTKNKGKVKPKAKATSQKQDVRVTKNIYKQISGKYTVRKSINGVSKRITFDTLKAAKNYLSVL